MDKKQQLVEYLIAWYPENARDLPWRRDKEPYHVWLSEIMLQQTRVEAVKEYYKRFLEALPDIRALAEVPEDRLLKLWEGLGYYNRVRNLQKAAQTIMNEYDGSFPTTYEQIRGLSGIGDYTAGAIGSICFELQTPAVDGNVLRVYTRVMEDASNIDKQSTRNLIRDELSEVYPKGRCGILTQSIMELGATVCVPNGAPKCTECPLNSICGACENNSWQRYPVRDEKKNRRIEERTVFVLRCGDKYAVQKRRNKGLLAGLWEFPNVEGRLDEQQAADVAAKWQTSPKLMEMNYNYTHIFSHVEWRMTAYYMEVQKMVKPYTWASIEEMDSDVAIPSAFRPFLDIAKKNAGYEVKES